MPLLTGNCKGVILFDTEKGRKGGDPLISAWLAVLLFQNLFELLSAQAHRPLAKELI